MKTQEKSFTSESHIETKIETMQESHYLMDYEGNVKFLITTADRLKVSLETLVELVGLLKHIADYGFTAEKIKKIEAEIKKTTIFILTR